MEVRSFMLDERYPDCSVTAYLHGCSPEMPLPPRRAIIICPGGAYMFLSDRENEPVALQYFAAGLNVFVLKYSIGEKAGNFAPVIEAALCIRHIRENAADYRIDPDYVFITGFSAGGHCAAMSGTHWNHPSVKQAIGEAPEGINRPTAMILCYPVITAGPYAHRLSIDTVSGIPHSDAGSAAEFSLENHVDTSTPPAFIWHTFNDAAVPIQNSLLFAEAMAAAGVPFEYHVYPDGPHGLSLCNEETWANTPALNRPEISGWIHEAIRYVKDFRI